MTEPQAPPENRPKKKSWLKRIFLGLLATVVAVVVLLVGMKAYSDSVYFEGYDPRLPLDTEVLETAETDSGIREKILFQATEGPKIPALFYLPKGATGQVPCVVLLYGIGQKMGFLDEIAKLYTEAGIAIICPEQLGQGERKPKQKETPFQGLRRLRERGRLTVIEARRVADYLETRPEIDPDRTILYGISLGAILGTSALALEPRFEAGMLMWGGGDFSLMFGGNREGSEEFGSVAKVIARFGGYYLGPADPIRRVADIAPRPLLFQNALHDEIIPKAATEAYFNKAGEPKSILWYDCGHEKGLNQEIVFGIIRDQLAWMRKVFEGHPPTS